MQLTQTAYGTWSGGRFMHFGEALDDERFLGLMRTAYEEGIRTFVTADTYGTGRADEMLGEALSSYDRDTYCLVGAVGHDFYKGQRSGAKGFPRFTDPSLRGESDYADYLEMATRRAADRCRTDRFDLVLLHNPDTTGYTNETVWEGMSALKEKGLTDQIGIAPGPANGFCNDLIDCFETFGELIDWAMVILNPMEPWPGSLVLPAAQKADIKILTRVVDFGGIFHGDVKPGHLFKEGDHRTYRPEGWVDHACEKLGPMQAMAEKHGLSLLQFACQWNLAHPNVECVVPTVIQEHGEGTRPAEEKIRDLAQMPSEIRLSAAEVAEIASLGDNRGCMALKGASTRHPDGFEYKADEWPMRPELLAIAEREGFDPNW